MSNELVSALRSASALGRLGAGLLPGVASQVASVAAELFALGADLAKRGDDPIKSIQRIRQVELGAVESAWESRLTAKFGPEPLAPDPYED